jgi:hypothetical protein
MSGDGRPRDRLLLPGLLTGVWLLAAIAIASFRLGEWWPLLEPSSERLALNAIGDFLAGVFAPLAFLWLFVATVLQRRELRLQREELAETRNVLAGQQRELEVTARENARQTIIMNDTLEATRATVIYDEFSLRLYYLARFISIEHAKLGFVARHVDGSYGAVSLFPERATVRENNATSTDDVFHTLLRHVPGVTQASRTPSDRSQDQDGNFAFIRSVAHINDALLHLLERYQTNPLASARSQALRLQDLQAGLAGILQWFRPIDLNAPEHPDAVPPLGRSA